MASPNSGRPRRSSGAEQAGPHAVVEVVVVVGDVVGKRGGLRFEARPLVEAEVQFAVQFRDGGGNGPGLGGPVMLGEPFQRFPGQVQAVEGGVAGLQPGDDAERLHIVVEAAAAGERGVERGFARMAEGRVAEVVGQRQRLRQGFLEREAAADAARDLADFQRVGQPAAVMVALMRDEHLRLVLQPAEGGGMEDAVAVALEGRAVGRLRLRPAPAAPGRGRGGIGRKRRVHRRRPAAAAAFARPVGHALSFSGASALAPRPRPVRTGGR